MDETPTVYEEAVERLTTAAPGMRVGVAEALLELGDADPEVRQPITDAICAWLRTPAHEVDVRERRMALRLLADRLRLNGPTPPWEEISVRLSGATLTDADFGDCQLDTVDFTDTRFHGTTRFDGAAVADYAAFHRAVFHGDATFAGARFGGDAEFGRVRFRSWADFTGVEFGGTAWFGRGAHTWWDDDEAWDTVEDVDPAPWDELNEDDPGWPVAVLIEDYQDWEEGGDGARFADDVSFRDASFAGPAWFYYARFGAGVTFAGAWFAGRVHLDQPVVDLAGARWSGNTDDGDTVLPLGWTTTDDGVVVSDPSVLPYDLQLADRDPATRSAGLDILVRLGDERPDLRQPIVVTLCALLREPIPFDLRAEGRTLEQSDLLQVRLDAQWLLASRLRPGPSQWKDMNLFLCGATLVDLDFSGCEAAYADFDGAQFHGTTRFDGSRFDRASFTLDGPSGRATFHGDVVFGTDPPELAVYHGEVR